MEESMLSTLAKYMIETVPIDFTSADPVNTVLNFTIAFENKYNKKIIVANITDTIVNIMGSDYLETINARIYYPYSRAAKMLRNHENFLVLLET